MQIQAVIWSTHLTFHKECNYFSKVILDIKRLKAQKWLKMLFLVEDAWKKKKRHVSGCVQVHILWFGLIPQSEMFWTHVG